MVRRIYGILFLMMILCVGCEWQLKPSNNGDEDIKVAIERYDRIEGLYLTTGDYSALQQMYTNYPMQTRMLIEDMLHLGKVDDPEINTKFLHFFQDSTLQAMLYRVRQQYVDMDDINADLTAAFTRLHEELPAAELPVVYTQVGSFDQSIVIGNGTLGISLDKYLGADYPFYLENYTDDQRKMMVRSMIVPDCLGFYLLSLYPIPFEQRQSQELRDQHMGRIQWVVNRLMGRKVFSNTFVLQASEVMKHQKNLSIDQLLRLNQQK